MERYGKIHTWSEIKIIRRIEKLRLEIEVCGRINITSLRFRFRVKDNVCICECKGVFIGVCIFICCI